jgi:MFS family permease
MIVMALSPLFWGPMSQVYGRRSVSACGVLQSVLWLEPGGQFVPQVLTQCP